MSVTNRTRLVVRHISFADVRSLEPALPTLTAQEAACVAGGANWDASQFTAQEIERRPPLEFGGTGVGNPGSRE